MGRNLTGVFRVGAHVRGADLLDEARARDADLVQTFLGDPQGWKAPVVPDGIADLAVQGVDLYVHAPYIVNVASPNNKIRVPSRKILTNHVTAAAAVGARGLVVHGGHVGKGEDPQVGIDNWVKTFERMERPLPVLVENTAGGDSAMARRFDALARLWDAIGSFDGVGFCLDTCHAHAAVHPTHRPDVNASTPSAIRGAAVATYAVCSHGRRSPASASSSQSGNHSSVARATDR